MALVSSLVAKIETSTKKGKKIGTAYPVSDGYIITAYHVFPDIDDLSNTKIYWHRNDDVKSGEELDDGASISEIVYQNKKYDIVIAKCPTPEHTNSVRLCYFGSVTGNWTSLGYAKSGQDHNKKIRLKDPAGGSVFQSLDDDWILQLESKGNASDVKLWRGMSGAPVFQESTNTLVGIIIETPRKDKEGNSVHDDRLYAVSIPYLLKNCPEFQKEINFKNDVAVFLENAATLVKKEDLIGLFTHYDETIPDEALHLCLYLSRLSIPEFLDIIAALQQKEVKKKAALGQLVCTILPHLFDDEKAIKIREGIGDSKCSLVEVPYTSNISIEMLMAKVDYRQANITKYTQKEFSAKYRLPLSPESGSDQAENKDDISKDMYQMFALDQQRIVKNITKELNSSIVEESSYGDFAKTEKRTIKRVNFTLKKRAEKQKASYYFIVYADAVGGKDEVKAFSAKLKEMYSYCTVISCDMNEEKEEEEADSYYELRSILAPYLTADNTHENTN